MTVKTSDFIQIEQLPTGRRLHALRRAAWIAQRMDAPAIAAGLATAIAHDEATHALELEWLARARMPRGTFGVNAIEILLTNTLVGLRDGVLARTDDDDADEIARLLTELFPDGTVGSLPRDERPVALDALVRALHGPLADRAAAIGVTRHARQLASQAKTYRDALRAERDRLDYPALLRARARGHDAMCEFVAVVLGRYPHDTPAHTAARSALLGPIAAAREVVRACRRARTPVTDVDPSTGIQVAPPDEPDTLDLRRPRRRRSPSSGKTNASR